MAAHLDPFLAWFRQCDGSFDSGAMGFADFPEHGRGAVALRDIPEGHTIFTIPRSLTLSIRTSSLPPLLGRSAWDQFGLGDGWAGLILCMMWEQAQGAASKWSRYFDILPSAFDTPMFWSGDELHELKGTGVVGKIGKDDAARDYNTKVVPAIASRPDLFSLDSTPLHYSLEMYHIMGSRILSRSFHVEQWKDDGQEDFPEGEAGPEHNQNDALPMDVDGSADAEDPADGPDVEDIIELDEDDDDAENPADVAMVPMADMLNARFESENAKLFYEQHVLKMVTTKEIKRGEQIWNTYGDPPNADLLRRYGHVDVVPLRPPLIGEGNPEDVVEIPADLITSIAAQAASEDLQERVDWWLEVADDDVFVIGTTCELPEDMVSFVRLLLLSKEDWEKTRTKTKLPKAKVDAGVLSIAEKVLSKRLEEYPTTIEEDEGLLRPENAQTLTLRKKYAVIVRLGEKRIIFGTMSVVKQLRDALQAAGEGSSKRKRGRDNREGEPSSRGKRVRR